MREAILSPAPAVRSAEDQVLQDQASQDRLLSRALGWVHTNVDRFAPGVLAQRAPQPRLKELLDLAIVCRTLHTLVLSADSSVIVEHCLDRVHEVFCWQPFQEGLLRSPTDFRYYLWLHAILRDTGRAEGLVAQESLDQLIAAGHGGLGSTAPAVAKMSDSAIRETIELRYVLDIAGLTSALNPANSIPAIDDLLPSSALFQPFDPRDLTESRAFDITHAVLYASDMCATRVSLQADQHAEAADLVEKLLRLFVCAGHWDLTAELLLCRLALGMPETSLADLSRKALHDAQRPDGAIPGPHLAGEVVDTLLSEARTEEIFSRCNHTTLATILCAARYEATGNEVGRPISSRKRRDECHE